MSLPKNKFLMLLLIIIWGGGNLATIHWQLQGRSWFGGLVFAALGLTFVIQYVDYRLNKQYYDNRPKRLRSHTPVSRPVAIGFVLFFVAILTFAGVSNIGIGNTTVGLIFIVFALACLIGGLFGKPANPDS